MKRGMNTPPAAGGKQQAIQEALALHREGKHELAMQRYVAILQQDPGNLDALYYVAMIALQQGQIEEGLPIKRHWLLADVGNPCNALPSAKTTPPLPATCGLTQWS